MPGLSELLADQGLRLHHRLASLAREAPEAPALVTETGGMTRIGLQRHVAAARALLTGLGVRPGDRVMLVQEGSVAAIALAFGALTLDAAVVPVEAMRPAWEIAALRALCDPRLVLHFPASSPEATALAAAAQAREVSDDLLGTIAAEALHDSAPDEAGLPAGRQAAFLMPVMRDGARPLAAVLTHRGLAWNAALVAQERGLTAADRVGGVDLLTSGLGTVLLPALHAGAAVVVARDVVAAATNHAATVLHAPPALLSRAIEAVGLDAPRIMGLAGAPADAALTASFEPGGGVRLARGYEHPEAGPCVAFVRAGRPVPALSAGPPLPGVELRIVDPAGNAVAPGEPGELLVRGAGVMAGYFRDAAATAAAFAAGRFLRTGDLASRDLEGNLYLHGRMEAPALRAGE